MKYSLEKIGLDRFSWENLNLKSLSTPGNGLAATVGAVVGPHLTFLYGEGRKEVLAAFVGMIVFDWFTGIAAARRDKVYASEYGIAGISRTLFILLFPALANILDRAMGIPGFLFYSTTFAPYLSLF